MTSSRLRAGRLGETVGLDSVSHSYGRTTALARVTLTFDVGTTALLGRNGAGKSTLCRILTGLEQPDTGAVVRGGRPMESRRDRRHHHACTGWLPQRLDLPLGMTVEQYLQYAAWLKDLDRRAADSGVSAALLSADLEEHRRRRLRHLSGGMQRRAGIAQAIVHDPGLIILDEPTVGLDPEQRSWFHEVIRRLGSQRRVLISTHLLEDVDAVADRVVVLDEGTVRCDEPVAQFRARAGRSSSPAEELRDAFRAVLDGGRP